jgi:hypothetical protein
MTWPLVLESRLRNCTRLIRLLIEIVRGCGLDMLTALGFQPKWAGCLMLWTPVVLSLGIVAMYELSSPSFVMIIQR